MSTHYKTAHDKIEVAGQAGTIVLRQDRITADDESVYLRLEDGNMIEVMDYAPFGLAVFSESELPATISNAPFIVQNVDLGTYELIRVRSEAFFFRGRQGFKIGFKVVGEPILVERAQAVCDINSALQSHASELSAANIPEAFRLVTYETRNWLSSLEEKVNVLEKNSFEVPRSYLDPYENTVTMVVAHYVENNISAIYKKIEKMLKGLEPTTIKACFEFFRNSVSRFMYQSPYAHRAFHKPRGYAGDSEMMSTIYRAENRGKTLFGKCMERYFVNVPENQAVRNRGRLLMTAIADLLKERPGKPVRILSIACGPAFETQSLILEQPGLLHEGVEFYMVDQDVAALKDCQRSLESLVRQLNVKAKFTFKNWAIKNMIESGISLNNIDLAYTAGLFDYLSSPVAQVAAMQIYKCLAPKGKLLIGNFDFTAPNRFAASLVTDWNLIYRTADDLKQLFSPISEVEIVQEELGINLFALLRKK